MLTQKERIEQKRLESLLKAEQHRQKEHRAKLTLSAKNTEPFYSKGVIKKRIELGHHEDYDLSYTKKKKAKHKTKYIHVKKVDGKVKSITDYVIK